MQFRIIKRIPNALTIARIAIAPLCFWLILSQGNLYLLAALVFLAAMFMDFLDGYIARKYNCVSKLGKILDPIADKVLILGVFLALTLIGAAHVWVFCILAAREMALTFVRMYILMRFKIAIPAGRFGKIKTFLQTFSILLILLLIFACQQHLASQPSAGSHLTSRTSSIFALPFDVLILQKGFFCEIFYVFFVVTEYIILLTVFFTLFSFFVYLRRLIGGAIERK